MHITFDHNCLIHLENGGKEADAIRSILDDSNHQCYVVNVGASEMQRFGVRPDNYASFENFLKLIGAAQLPRLDPLGIWNVTFFDRCLYAGEADQKLLTAIQDILFPVTLPEEEGDDRKALNRLCDALTLWCHISYKNDVFLTTDKNFLKSTKLPKLLKLGVGRICLPWYT
jgi:hypothetical protein